MLRPGLIDSDNDEDVKTPPKPNEEPKDRLKKPASADKAFKKFDYSGEQSPKADSPVESGKEDDDHDTGSCFKLGKNVLNISDEKMN